MAIMGWDGIGGVRKCFQAGHTIHGAAQMVCFKLGGHAFNEAVHLCCFGLGWICLPGSSPIVLAN